MPPKTKDKRTDSPSTSTNDRDELRNSIRSLLQEEMSDIKFTIREEVKKSIKEEIKSVLKEEFGDHLSHIERELTKLTTVYDKVQDVEAAINFNSQRLDDICQTSLPALASHVEKVATALALQTLDIDVHRRKWSLAIHGVKGKAGETEADTRSSCVALARQHLGVANATEADFSACHRLNQREDAGIIIRFNVSIKKTFGLRERRIWSPIPTKSVSVRLCPRFFAALSQSCCKKAKFCQLNKNDALMSSIYANGLMWSCMSPIIPQ